MQLFLSLVGNMVNGAALLERTPRQVSPYYIPGISDQQISTAAAQAAQCLQRSLELLGSGPKELFGGVVA